MSDAGRIVKQLSERLVLGAVLDEVEVVRYFRPYTMGNEIELMRARVYSNAWDIPDEVHAASMREVERWVAAASWYPEYVPLVPA